MIADCQHGARGEARQLVPAHRVRKSRLGVKVFVAHEGESGGFCGSGDDGVDTETGSHQADINGHIHLQVRNHSTRAGIDQLQ